MMTIFFVAAVSPILAGTVGMLMLALGLIAFIFFYQRRMLKIEAEQQKMLLTATIKLQEEERQRIAADLHDEAGPLLATARLYLSESIVDDDKQTQLETIASTKEIIDEAIQLVRNISHTLMPPTLKNFGLESAVNDFFQKLHGTGALRVGVQFHNYETRLKAEKELMAFRVIQELTNNILKHSQATFIELSQASEIDQDVITLQHDGKGLTQEAFLSMAKGKGGLGLKNIQSRLKVVQGEIQFEYNIPQSVYKVFILIPREADEKKV